MPPPHPRVAAETSAGQPPRLPADLAKLRDRFLADYPHLAVRAALLSQVPIALRHLLSLHLDLTRADALPRRYRDLAEATPDSTLTGHGAPDAVDRLVIAYAAAMRSGDQPEAARQVPKLRRYFTEPQIVELTLILTLNRAFTQFDALLGLE
jgi:hypothetical protein